MYVHNIKGFGVLIRDFLGDILGQKNCGKKNSDHYYATLYKDIADTGSRYLRVVRGTTRDQNGASLQGMVVHHDSGTGHDASRN